MFDKVLQTRVKENNDRYSQYLNRRVEYEAARMLKILWDGTFKLKGDSNFEKLVDLSVKLRNKQSFTDSQLVNLAKNTVIENNVYFTTIYMGEDLSHKMPIQDYVLNWSQDAEFRNKFEEIFKKVQENRLQDLY
jgi:hypothetical protein